MSFSYTFTNNNLLLDQYFSLRQKIYNEEFNQPVGIDMYDVKSRQLIIQDEKGVVVGGARVTPKDPGNLPMEDLGVNLSSYNYKQKICEVGRVVVAKEHRSMEVFTTIFESIKQQCIKDEIFTLLVIGHPKTVRLDAIMCSKTNLISKTFKEVQLDKPFFTEVLGQVNLLEITIPH